MTTLQGRGLVSGKGGGPALVTRMPVNFTASFSKLANLLPGKRAVVQDRHHELYRQDLEGKVLVFPAAIGSTYTGMMLLELMYRGSAPAALVVRNADSLLVSGSVLADVWFKRAAPIVEYRGDDLFDEIETGDQVEVDGGTGEIRVSRSRGQ